MGKLTGEKLRTLIGDYLLMTLGVILYCASWECFMIPNGMSSGGLTGLCTVIQYATGGRLEVSFLYAVANVFLLLIAFLVMGARFGFKTIYCIALASVIFKLFSLFPQAHSLEGHFLYVPERILIPAIAAALVLALGIYQAYISVAACLFLLLMLRDALDGEKTVPEIIRFGAGRTTTCAFFYCL